MPRYTICPFYIDENKLTISCEDVIRRFDDLRDKCDYMDTYCDASWIECPHARRMTEAYDAQEKGDNKAVEKNKIASLETEVKGLHIKLGRAEKKIEKLQAVNNSFIGKNEDLEKQKKSYYERWKAADTQLKEYERRIGAQIQTLSEIYEQRLAYMIETCMPDRKLYEDEIQEWAGDRAYAIILEEDAHGKYWKVVFEEDAGKTDNIQNEIPKAEQ